jgi:hypothetical protein
MLYYFQHILSVSTYKIYNQVVACYKNMKKGSFHLAICSRRPSDAIDSKARGL